MQPSDTINAETRFCAVLGHPVRHSASPVMQNAAMRSMNLNWKYLAFDVLPDRLPSVLSGAGALGFIGFNLTVPHKTLAFDLVDIVDPSAKAWGAVNTILFEGKDERGHWRPTYQLPCPGTETRCIGYNTDADAVVRSIREDLELELRGSKILVLGAGGAGRVAVLRLAMEDPDTLYLVNRTRSKIEGLASEVSKLNPQVKVVLNYPEKVDGPIDLVLNATSLGLKPSDPLPADQALLDFKQVKSVYDMIYMPSRTPLLTGAKAAGCRVANGVGMLLYQGARSLEIWSGKEPPIQEMRKALLNHVYGGSI